MAFVLSRQVEQEDTVNYSSHDSMVGSGGINNGFGPNNANMNDFMMRLSGSCLNYPGIRVSVNWGAGGQEYKYEGHISLTCRIGGRDTNSVRCTSYTQCS
jgi:hypothetical protein